MTRYEVIFDGRLVSTGADRVLTNKDVESFVDLFADALGEHQGEDIGVSSNLKTHEITVSVTLEKDDLLAAQEKGSSFVRASLLAAAAAAAIDTPGCEIAWTRARTVLEMDNHPEFVSA